MMWLSRRRNARDDCSRQASLMQRLSRQLHIWGEAMAGLDDPLGDYLSRLDERVRRLEGEVQELRELPSVNVAATGTMSSTASLQQHNHNTGPRA